MVGLLDDLRRRVTRLVPLVPRTTWKVRRVLSSWSSSHSLNGNYRLLRLDAGKLDHLCPLLGLLGDELAEVGGRAGHHGAAQVGKPRLHLGIAESRVDLPVEPVDD